MERYRAIFSHLLHQPLARSVVAGKVFVTKPADDVERRWGRCFGLLTVEPNDRPSLALLEFIADTVKQAYYETEEHPTHGHDRAGAPRVPARFEAALRRANHRIAEYLEGEESAADLDTLQAVVGVALGPAVTLTTVGGAAVFVVHARRPDDYVVSEITGDRRRAASPNPLYLFTQSLQGTLGPTDYLCCTTANLLDYLSLERVRTAVTQHPLPTASRLIREALGVAREPGTFISILVGLLPQAAPATVPAASAIADAAQRDSMRRLSRTQAQTDSLLTPRLLPRLKQAAAAAGRALVTAVQTARRSVRNPLRSPAPPTPDERGAPLAEPATPTVAHAPATHAQASPLTQVARFARALAVISGALLVRLWSSRPLVAVRRVLAARLWALGRWYRRQSPRQRLATAGIVVVSALLIINIGSRVISRGAAQRNLEARALLQSARQAVDAASASIIYGDEGAARRTLQSAQASVEGALTLGAAPADVAALRRSVEDALASLRRANTVAAPTLINNFTNLDAGADIAPAALWSPGALAAQNRRNGSLYPLALDTRVLGAPTAPDQNLEAFAHATAADGGTLVVTQTGHLLRLRLPRLTTESVPLPLPANARPVATATYLGRLYVLDPPANQVWRFDRAGSGFGAPTSWLQDDTVRLAAAVDLVVDGDVYILHAEGRLTKLTSGVSVPFTLETVDPPLQRASKLKLVGDALYVLDPAQRRVVVWGKDGAFRTQFLTPTLDDLKDFVVLEKEKKLYLLSGSAVWGIPLR